MKTAAHRNSASLSTNIASHEVDSIACRRVSLVSEAVSDSSRPRLIWEPCRSASEVPTATEVLHKQLPKNTISNELERHFIATLERPLAAHETYQAGNANRERELRALFATLSPVQALALRRRLNADRNDDALAVAFRRVVVERRNRFIAFLESPYRARG